MFRVFNCPGRGQSSGRYIPSSSNLVWRYLHLHARNSTASVRAGWTFFDGFFFFFFFQNNHPAVAVCTCASVLHGMCVWRKSGQGMNDLWAGSRERHHHTKSRDVSLPIGGGIMTALRGDPQMNIGDPRQRRYLSPSHWSPATQLSK